VRKRFFKILDSSFRSRTAQTVLFLLGAVIILGLRTNFKLAHRTQRLKVFAELFSKSDRVLFWRFFFVSFFFAPIVPKKKDKDAKRLL
jgi:hypothetical protein